MKATKIETPKFEITQGPGKGSIIDVPENAPWAVFLDGKLGFYSDKEGMPDALVLIVDVPEKTNEASAL